MSIECISIGSSSSGNSYIIRTKDPDSVILVDVGLTAKRISGALDDCGIDPADVDAVLITHEHTDHVKSVRAVSRKCRNALFVASRGTIENTSGFVHVPDERIKVAEAGESFEINSDNCKDITINAFALSHDASEPLGYSVMAGDDKIALVTDTGVVTDEIYDAVRDADMLVFESNHDEDLLMYGEYPYYLKMRIKGDYGHLSNRYAGEVLADILRGRGTEDRLKVMLAHLSDHNNMPFVAGETVSSILSDAGFEQGCDYSLSIAAKEVLTRMQ